MASRSVTAQRTAIKQKQVKEPTDILGRMVPWDSGAWSGASVITSSSGAELDGQSWNFFCETLWYSLSIETPFGISAQKTNQSLGQPVLFYQSRHIAENS